MRPTALPSPTTGLVINMEAAKRTVKKKSQPSLRGMDQTGMPSAEEALKKYYDKMLALDLKLKNEMEN